MSTVVVCWQRRSRSQEQEPALNRRATRVAGAAGVAFVLMLISGCSEVEQDPTDDDNTAQVWQMMTSDIATNLTAQSTNRAIQIELSVTNNGPQTIFRPTTLITFSNATIATMNPPCTRVTSTTASCTFEALQDGPRPSPAVTIEIVADANATEVVITADSVWGDGGGYLDTDVSNNKKTITVKLGN